MKSVMTHQFSMVPHTSIERSSFNRSHGYKTTLDENYLIPFYVDEVLPGDTFKLDVSMLTRMTTPIVPIFDNLFVDTHFFFCPNRLLWEHWQAMNGEQENPGDSTDYLLPTITAPEGGFAPGSLADYFGIPTGISNIEVNSLPFRAYNLIYNEWFRCEYLIDSKPVPKGDTDDSANYELLKRGKRFDYFTSALPWPQRGPGVEIPLGKNAPVWGSARALQIQNGNGSTNYVGSLFQNGNGDLLGGTPLNSSVNSLVSGDTMLKGRGVGVITKSVAAEYGVTSSGLYADLSDATAYTINTLRQAFQLQRLYERDARGGTRYTEILRSHFGVVSPDARLQRPEYLGGSSSPISITPVVQQSSTDTVTPQGNLAAFGVSGSHVHGFKKSFVEHGYIIGFISIRADLNYQQGLNRMWSRQGRFDFFWPALAHLGEQSILNKEIYIQGNSQDDEVFGYQERYAEYRYYPSLITGKMRSTDPQSLDYWHLAQKFDNLPVLNEEFINENVPIERVVAVPSEPHFLLDAYFDLECIRPMPLYGVPGLIDHF